MNPEIETGRSEMKSVVLNTLDRMLGELITKQAIESNEVVKSKMAYGEKLLRALRQNLSKVSIFEMNGGAVSQAKDI